MPNRILKESIRESDSIDALNWFQEVLFYRLIVSCDDYGRFDGRTSVIKNRLFPLKEDLTLKNVADAIQKLVSVGLVVLYEHDGKPFLYLPSWTAHQNVRAKRSKYPEPVTICDNVNTSASRCIHDEGIGNQLQGNVPVIQSESLSVSESISISESKSISGGGDDARASEKELAFIGLKKDEWGNVTRVRVKKTVQATEDLFRKWRPDTQANALDRRMVFQCSDQDGNTELLDYAFEQAKLAGKVSDWRYIAGIILALRQRGIQTVEQARRWDEERPDTDPAEKWDAILQNMRENRERKKGAGK